MAEPDAESALLTLSALLHDLCQPLTALYCRLEIGQIRHQATMLAKQTHDDTTVFVECLQECERLSKTVATMRTLLQRARVNHEEKNG